MRKPRPVIDLTSPYRQPLPGAVWRLRWSQATGGLPEAGHGQVCQRAGPQSRAAGGRRLRLVHSHREPHRGRHLPGEWWSVGAVGPLAGEWALAQRMLAVGIVSQPSFLATTAPVVS